MEKNSSKTDANYWNNRWGKYCRVYRVRKWDKTWGPKGSFLRVIKRYLRNLEDIDIIELGGAASYFSVALAKWGKAKVKLIDYSLVGLEKTKIICQLNNCHVETVHGDFFTWEHGVMRYDVVVHWGLLEHFSNPREIFRVSNNLLRPGGIMIFSMPNMRAFGEILWKKFSKDDWERHIYHSKADICKAGEVEGFELVDSFYWGPPLIQIAPNTNKKMLIYILTMIQYAFTGLGMLIPLYHIGHEKISVHRGFVLRKVAK